MLSQGFRTEYVSLIQEIYNNSESRIILEKNGPYLPINRGVKHGDPLSPALFNCTLEDLFRKVNWTNKCIQINGRYRNNLRFADDLVLIGSSKIELTEMINEINPEDKKYILEISSF